MKGDYNFEHLNLGPRISGIHGPWATVVLDILEEIAWLLFSKR